MVESNLPAHDCKPTSMDKYTTAAIGTPRFPSMACVRFIHSFSLLCIITRGSSTRRGNETMEFTYKLHHIIPFIAMQFSREQSKTLKKIETAPWRGSIVTQRT